MPLPPSKLSNRIKLSRQDMCGISRAISRDFSPRFFRSRTASKATCQFSAQELLEISRQISREYTPNSIGQTPTLVLLAVSPKRLHAYWHSVKQRLNQALKRIDQQSMTLRIYTESELETPETPPSDAVPNWFDITIAGEDGHQDIYLPGPVPASAPLQYRAALGQIQSDSRFVPLAYSNTAATPTPTSNRLANVVTQFIMPNSIPASSAGKTASGQGK